MDEAGLINMIVKINILAIVISQLMFFQTIGAAFCRKDINVEGQLLSLAIWVSIPTFNSNDFLIRGDLITDIT